MIGECGALRCGGLRLPGAKGQRQRRFSRALRSELRRDVQEAVEGMVVAGMQEAERRTGSQKMKCAHRLTSLSARQSRRPRPRITVILPAIPWHRVGEDAERQMNRRSAAGWSGPPSTDAGVDFGRRKASQWLSVPAIDVEVAEITLCFVSAS